MEVTNQVIAIDWSHTKNLTTFDGQKTRTETLKQLIKRLHKDGSDGESTTFIQSMTIIQPSEPDIEAGESRGKIQSTYPIHPAENGLGEESTLLIQSTELVHSPSLILEQGCPLSLLYNLILSGCQVFTIDNHATEQYREAHGIEKTDENDAKIIYELASNGAKLSPVSLNDKTIQLQDIYHQYTRYQKARVALENMYKAHRRQYQGWEAGESTVGVESITLLHPALPDLSPYTIAISVLEAREKTLLKRLETIAKVLPLFEMAGGESIPLLQSKCMLHPPAIKGLGQRLWWGIVITANPANFPNLSAYLRFCGLTGDAVKSHKYNRHARMLYHLLAEEVMKLRDPKFRPLYDKIKEELKAKYPDYTKGHIHNATLNRVATFLAKDIFSNCRSNI